MPKRDRSAEAVAREWLSDREDVCGADIAALLITDRRAERARVRRIVRGKMRGAEAAGQTVAAAYLRGILAALREGKGTR